LLEGSNDGNRLLEGLNYGLNSVDGAYDIEGIRDSDKVGPSDGRFEVKSVGVSVGGLLDWTDGEDVSMLLGWTDGKWLLDGLDDGLYISLGKLDIDGVKEGVAEGSSLGLSVKASAGVVVGDKCGDNVGSCVGL
jgi:hypothetical protein